MPAIDAPSPPSPPPSRTPLDMSTRCSFATRDAFLERTAHLASDPHRRSSQARDISRRPTHCVPLDLDPRATAALAAKTPPQPAFETAMRVPSQFELRVQTAQRNGASRAPYRAPNDHCYRAESPPSSWRAPGTDFIAKFRLPTNQDVRRRVAIDQERFFTATATTSARDRNAVDMNMADMAESETSRRSPRRPPE